MTFFLVYFKILCYLKMMMFSKNFPLKISLLSFLYLDFLSIWNLFHMKYEVRI